MGRPRLTHHVVLLHVCNLSRLPTPSRISQLSKGNVYALLATLLTFSCIVFLATARHDPENQSLAVINMGESRAEDTL